MGNLAAYGHTVSRHKLRGHTVRSNVRSFLQSFILSFAALIVPALLFFSVCIIYKTAGETSGNGGIAIAYDDYRLTLFDNDIDVGFIKYLAYPAAVISRINFGIVDVIKYIIDKVVEVIGML